LTAPDPGKSKAKLNLNMTSSTMSRPATSNSDTNRTKRKSSRPLSSAEERIFIGVAFVVAFVVQIAIAFDLSSLLGQ
jgi:hypothetical protein